MAQYVIACCGPPDEDSDCDLVEVYSSVAEMKRDGWIGITRDAGGLMWTYVGYCVACNLEAAQRAEAAAKKVKQVIAREVVPVRQGTVLAGGELGRDR